MWHPVFSQNKVKLKLEGRIYTIRYIFKIVQFFFFFFFFFFFVCLFFVFFFFVFFCFVFFVVVVVVVFLFFFFFFFLLTKCKLFTVYTWTQLFRVSLA